jgi:methionyl-tRNA synthetase
MLKAMGVAMPETVFAHGWWLSGQDKMSKTRGNVVNPIDFAQRYGVDAFRYFVMAEMALGQDASFTEEAFRARYNADLANDLGNLLSRVMKLMGSHFDSRIPEPGTIGIEEDGLLSSTSEAALGMIQSVERMRIDQGLSGLIQAVREVNRYLERTQPWTLAKTGQKEKLGTVLYVSAECLRRVGEALSPVMPGKMTELLGALGVGPVVAMKEGARLIPGSPLGGPVTLFPRVKDADDESAEVKKESPSAPAQAPVSPAIPPDGVCLIEYADFTKVQLRTARIITAERVTGADKLLRLEIEIGQERRQIVAGIAVHYAPDTLPGRMVIVVFNLKPAKIRGVESNGMLLAASAGGVMRLVTVDGDIPSGAVVK